MRAYALFGYGDYYPSGGTNDLIGVFGSVAEAKVFADADNTNNKYVEIAAMDPEGLSLEVVEEGVSKGPYNREAAGYVWTAR